MPGGKRPANELKNLAKANKISDRTLDRARKELGIVSKREEFKGAICMDFPRVFKRHRLTGIHVKNY